MELVKDRARGMVRSLTAACPVSHCTGKTGGSGNSVITLNT